MSKIYTLFILLFFLLLSCQQKTERHKKYGGNFSMVLDNTPNKLIARNANDNFSVTLLNQVLEGLVGFDEKRLTPVPAIAKAWYWHENPLSLEFVIRDSVFFHRKTESEPLIMLTPEDVSFSIHLACKPDQFGTSSMAFESIYKNNLVGALDFFEGKTDKIQGITIDGNSITLQLYRKDLQFIDKLASVQAAVVMKQKVENNQEHLLYGTGPFVLKGSINENNIEKIILIKNKDYYLNDNDGLKLPYLDSVTLIIENDLIKKLNLFQNGTIDLVDGLSPKQIASFLEVEIEKFNTSPPLLKLLRTPLLGSQYYYFNMKNEIFSDVNVRKAINYAVDRKEIIEKILNNQAYAIGDKGVVPPVAYRGFLNAEKSNFGYELNVKTAQALLKKAGYPNGENFPSFEIKFNKGTVNALVAQSIANQLKENLNINVVLDGVEFEDLLTDQMLGNGDLIRTSWYADYTSPESFLAGFYGSNVPDDNDALSKVNLSRYTNPKFDHYFEQAVKSKDLFEQFNLFLKAEEELMKNPPVLILWYMETIKILNARFTNFSVNELDFIFLKHVYKNDF